MLRRNLFRWISTSVAPLLAPRWSRGQASGIGTHERAMVIAMAEVVLPSSLGEMRTEEIAREFIEWTRGYRAGADAGYGYGFARLQILPENPAVHYPEQFQELERAAYLKGSSFAMLDATGRREIIARALEEAQVDRIPARPNGKHVSADLLAFFYSSADGQDFLYQAAIKRDDCRGLSTSAERPRPLS